MSRFAVALDRLADLTGRAAAAFAAALMVCVAAYIIYEIVLRNVFATSTYVVDEVVGYAVGAMTLLAMAHTFRSGDMIRVRILFARLPDRGRRMLEILCVLLTLLPLSLVAFYFARSALRSWTEGAVGTGLLAVPLWVPEGIFLIGLLLFVLQLIAYALRLAVDPTASLIQSDIPAE